MGQLTPTCEISLEHAAPRKRIGVVGYLAWLEGDASEPGEVRCGIPATTTPGNDYPPAPNCTPTRCDQPTRRCAWEVKGRRHAAFTTDFGYRSGP